MQNETRKWHKGKGDDSPRVSILGACCKDMDRKTTIEPT
jgi:hypothetical protein